MKTKKSTDLIAGLEETFVNLRMFHIKLNPKKCVFGVPKGKLLGFMVSDNGIEANKENIEAIQRMGPIHNLKGIQQMIGCIVTLTRFVSWLGERDMPLYKLLNKGDQFSWTQKAQEAFNQIKAFQTSPLILVVSA